ncbi:MAG TPA: hypothetical protein DCL60_11085 [Armatimonadetes bacterium]|nr:hypothetical protein [Armatimonadota bacterium]
MEKFSYTANFDETDPVQFWIGSKDYTVNFKGLTDEKSAEGKKCFKLDITLGSSAFVYWNIPMPRPVPAEGILKFSGRVYLGEASTGTAVLMSSYSYPPSTIRDFTMPLRKMADKGKWLPVQGDLVDIGKIPDIGRWEWGGPDNGRYLDRVLVRLNGQKGDRVVIYLDDFKIEGEVPARAEYTKEVNRRWAPIREKVEKQAAKWRASLEKNAKYIEDINADAEFAIQVKKEALAKIPGLRARIKTILSRGAMSIKEFQQIDNGIKDIEGSKHNLATQLLLAGKSNIKLVVTTLSPISSLPVLTTGFYGTMGSKLSVTAAQGEYEPASFVVHAMQGTKALAVEASDLKQGKNVIPASNIDIKAVKCWYQAGTAWYNIEQNKSTRVLVPELMLNDDSLVKVDTEKKENYLKLGFPDGEKYVWISDPNETSASIKKSQSVKDFPVKDSPTLLPVDIPANENKQFWITVKVPESAAPGTYTGKIRLASAEGDKSELTLNLNVLPFKLPKPYYDSSIYYRGTLDPQNIGSISSENKSKVQLAEELKDMVAHGVDKPTMYQEFGDKELLKEYLSMRKAAGIVNDPLYYLGLGFWKKLPGIDKYKEFLEFATVNGIKDVYFYGIDEAAGDALTAQKKTWTEVRKLGGKVFVASYTGENFKKMGDIQDLNICAFYPDKAEAERWHSAGHKIWCYNNPQGGVENPEVYRRNYGLILSLNNYDGAATYAYQHSFGNIWNDFDHRNYRDHNFTYPTVDSVIDTIAWEGYREGVDDVRYLTTLVEAVKSAKASKDSSKIKAVQSAEKYLAELKTADLSTRDLSTVRSEIVRHILEVTK